MVSSDTHHRTEISSNPRAFSTKPPRTLRLLCNCKVYYPISVTADLIQEARLVSGVYTVQTTGTVDAVYSTVIPSTLNDGDSFEWVVLASQ